MAFQVLHGGFIMRLRGDKGHCGDHCFRALMLESLAWFGIVVCLVCVWFAWFGIVICIIFMYGLAMNEMYRPVSVYLWIHTLIYIIPQKSWATRCPVHGLTLKLSNTIRMIL